MRRVWKASDEVELPARTILIAAGTQPNTVLAREDPEHFILDGRYFRAVDEDGNPVKPERSAKPARVDVLMAREPDGRFMSFFGDLHPSFFGNVVKAMGSAKQGFPVVSRVLAKLPARATDDAASLPRLAERAASRDRPSRRSPHAQDRRGDRARAARRAPVSPRPVLPPAELRVPRREARGHAPRDGRPRPHRRVGRPRRRASSRRSCSRWAARATCARCSSPASP